jgi:amino acid adenylation domain-containing protein
MEQFAIDPGLLERLCTLLNLDSERIKLEGTFIRNGGDSLLAIKFSNIIQASEHVHIGAGAVLRAKQIGALLDKSQLIKLATGVARLSSPCNTLLPLAAPSPHQNDHKTLDPIQRIPTTIPTAGLPLTFIQAGVAVYTHHVPGGAVQHVTQYCYTDLLPRLKMAFMKAMSSFLVFRLKFEVETSPLLVTATLKESFELNWAEQQVVSLEEANLEASFRMWSIEASTEPVFRIVTPRETWSERKLSAVHWFYHHSMLDGRSMDMLLQQVDAFIDHPSLPVQVNDRTFEVVQGLKQYHSTHEGAARAFWATREVHAGSRNHPLLRTLGDRTSSRVRMESINVFFHEEVKTFQSRTEFTFEVLVRAALGLVLAKLQSTSKVSLMSVSSRRSLPIQGLDQAVGNFATSMILTLDINKDDTAHDLMEQVFQKVLELEDMCYSDPSDGFSLGGLVVVSSDLLSHTPWYSAGHQTEVMAPKVTLPTLYVSSTGRVRFTYNSEWRCRSEMQVMTDLFEKALIILASGATNIGECLRDMLPASQKQQVLGWGNCSTTHTSTVGTDEDIVSTFQNQALERGNDVALQSGRQQISYTTLATMVRAVGRQLRKVLQPGSIVMIHADGSVNWVVAMFAVLWAHCVFAPQGVDLPHQLRSQHYAIAEAQAFLVPQEHSTTLTPDGCTLRLCVESIRRDAEDGREQNDEAATIQPNPPSAAYICFSSGTTGQPKAILCTHSGVVSVLRDAVARLHVKPGHRVAQTLAPSFDGALLEVFSALCYGGTLVLKDCLEPFANLRVADSLLITPSLAAELTPEDYPNLKYVYLCSEVLPQYLADRWSAGQAMVYNIYGPTECHMVASAQRVKPGQAVTIGKPLSSVRIYIVDTQGVMTPPLVAGEIHIAGVQVSQGYIGLEEETKRLFVPDTMHPTDGGRMYKTGDWGYWTMEGEVAFIGRTDRQVKLSGFRIDLNDVQAKIHKALSPAVRVAVVVVGDRLACAISDGNGIGEEQVRAAAGAVLPPHSVPKLIRCLESMPVSQFGKVDYRAVTKLLE